MKIFVVLTLFIIYFFPLHAQDYFPLSIGNTWSYNIINARERNIGESCLTIVGDTVLQDKHYYVTENYTKVSFMDNTIDTTTVGYIYDDGTNIYMMESLLWSSTVEITTRHTLAEGTHWRNNNGDSIWVTACGTVNVPAGDFDSCMAIHYQGRNHVEIVAPEVGLIKSEGSRMTNLALTSYTIIGPGIEPAQQPFLAKDFLDIRPNPAQGQARIRFNPANGRKAVLNIFNISGKLLKSFSGLENPYVEWHRNLYGSTTYIVQLKVADKVFTRKMVVLK